MIDPSGQIKFLDSSRPQTKEDSKGAGLPQIDEKKPQNAPKPVQKSAPVVKQGGSPKKDQKDQKVSKDPQPQQKKVCKIRKIRPFALPARKVVEAPKSPPKKPGVPRFPHPIKKPEPVPEEEEPKKFEFLKANKHNISTNLLPPQRTNPSFSPPRSKVA